MTQLMVSDDYLNVEKSKKFYIENHNYYNLLYKPLNNINSILFKKKVKQFLSECEPYFKFLEIESNLLKNQIINAISNDDYTVNHLYHYSFYISGKHYTFGIVEISNLIEQGLKIKRSMIIEQKSNVLNFKPLTLKPI